jgi:hypothetical protein
LREVCHADLVPANAAALIASKEPNAIADIPAIKKADMAFPRAWGFAPQDDNASWPGVAQGLSNESQDLAAALLVPRWRASPCTN